MAKKPVTKLDLSGSIEAIRAKLNDKYGANTIVSAEQASGMTVKHISTGVHELDLVLGGGLPQNRIIEFRGGFSSLKTTIALCAIKNFTLTYDEGLAVFVDAEHSFDPEYLDLLDIPKDRVEVVNPDSGEQACDVLLDYLSITNRDVFCVLDSIAALVPMAEVEASHEQQTMGVQARLVNKLMRTANARLKRSAYDSTAASATLLCLNQLREKIGVMFGNPETTPGGKGKEFYFSVILRVNSTPSSAITEEVTQNGETKTIRFGQVVKYNVLKCKVGGSQYAEGEFEYYIKPYKGHRAYSFNNPSCLFRWAVFYGVIKAGPKGFLYSRYDFLGKKESGYVDRLEAKKPGATKQLFADTLKAAIAYDRNVTTPDAEETFDAAEEETEVEVIEPEPEPIEDSPLKTKKGNRLIFRKG